METGTEIQTKSAIYRYVFCDMKIDCDLETQGLHHFRLKIQQLFKTTKLEVLSEVLPSKKDKLIVTDILKSIHQDRCWKGFREKTTQHLGSTPPPRIPVTTRMPVYFSI